MAKKQKKKTSLLLRLYRIAVLLSVLVIAASVAWHFAVPPPNMATSLTGVSQETGEILDLSATTQERKEGFYTFLLVGSDDGNGNADTIIVAGYDSKAGVVNLVSVPRDTLVYRSWSKFPKINAAFSKGVDVLAQEVSYTLGIRLDFTVVIGIQAFVQVVDAMGGIDFHVPQDMYHDDQGGFVIDLSEGYQHLDGQETLELVRFRGYATADIGRTEIQQEVLKTLAKQVISWNNLGKIQDFWTIFQEQVDTDLVTSDFLWFAKTVLTTPNLDITSYTLEGKGDAKYNGYTWCYQLDPQTTLTAVNDKLNPFTGDRTLEDLHLLIVS